MTTKRLTKILTHAEISVVSTLLNEILGKQVINFAESYGIKAEDMARFFQVASLCREKREEMGLSFKDLSSKLKIPQYRLKAIEHGRFSVVQLDVLEEYVAALGIAKWFNKWKTQNKELVETIKAKSR